MSTRKPTSLFWTSCLLALCSITALAQSQTTGRIAGTVKDPERRRHRRSGSNRQKPRHRRRAKSHNRRGRQLRRAAAFARHVPRERYGQWIQHS